MYLDHCLKFCDFWSNHLIFDHTDQNQSHISITNEVIRPVENYSGPLLDVLGNLELRISLGPTASLMSTTVTQFSITSILPMENGA